MEEISEMLKKIKNYLMPMGPGYVTAPVERVSYWSYFIGQNVFYTLVATYLSTYMMSIGVDVKKSAAVMLAVKIWDAVNDPLFGIIFDKVKFKNGKCLPWLKISLFLIPAATILMFIIPGAATETIKLVWFAIAYLLWDTFYTFCDVPIYSMITTMTPNLDERNAIMPIGRMMGGVGSAIATLIFPVLSQSAGVSFGWIAIILSIIGLLFMAPVCVKGKERNYNVDLQEESFSLLSSFRYLISNKYLLIYYIAYFFSSAANTSASVQMFVGFYLFGTANFVTIVGALGVVPAIISALLVPALTKKFDKFKLLVWSNIVNAALGYVMFFMGWQNATLIIILMIIRSIFANCAGMLGFMFTPDCAEYGQYKTGIDAKGITFSIQTFSAKITGAVSTSLGMFALGLFGWIEVQAESFEQLAQLNIAQPDSAMTGLWVTFMLIPSIGMTISGILYMFYKLNDKDVQIMAKCNAGEITKEEAEQQLSRKY